MRVQGRGEMYTRPYCLTDKGKGNMEAERWKGKKTTPETKERRGGCRERQRAAETVSLTVPRKQVDDKGKMVASQC